MLKVYVGAKMRLQEATDGFVNKLGELRSKNTDDGFASAEMIGLSVVGVLIAFAIYYAFQRFAEGDSIGNWLDSVLQRDS